MTRPNHSSDNSLTERKLGFILTLFVFAECNATQDSSEDVETERLVS